MKHLRHKRFDLWIQPALGGAVMGFNHNDRPILRDSRGGCTPTDTAAFPLVPFASRIENARFTFADKHVTLQKNFLPEPHAIHGEGWQNPWDIIQATSSSMTLEYIGAGQNWPWRYIARQTFLLEDDGLHLKLTLQNISNARMPAGLGWHPYFDAHEAYLDIAPGAIWQAVPGCTRTIAPPPVSASTQKVSALNYDHAFDWPTRTFAIGWAGHDTRVRLSASEAFNHVVLYTPKGQNFFCAEPISHAPNALHSTMPIKETGLRTLAPGKTLTGDIHLTIEGN